MDQCPHLLALPVDGICSTTSWSRKFPKKRRCRSAVHGRSARGFTSPGDANVVSQIPAVLYYQRSDLETAIDLSKLDAKPDINILLEDVSLSKYVH